MNLVLANLSFSILVLLCSTNDLVYFLFTRRMSAVLSRGLKNAPEVVEAICLGHELSQGKKNIDN